MHCLLSNDSEKIFIQAIDQHFTSPFDYYEDTAESLFFDANERQAIHYDYLALSCYDNLCKYGKGIKKSLKISELVYINHQCISELKRKVINDILRQFQCINSNQKKNKSYKKH